MIDNRDSNDSHDDRAADPATDKGSIILRPAKICRVSEVCFSFAGISLPASGIHNNANANLNFFISITLQHNYNTEKGASSGNAPFSAAAPLPQNAAVIIIEKPFSKAACGRRFIFAFPEVP